MADELKEGDMRPLGFAKLGIAVRNEDGEIVLAPVDSRTDVERERDRYRDALERIRDLDIDGDGLIAVDIAYEALEAPHG